MPRLRRSLACLGLAGALLLPALACSDSGPGPDTVATVNALKIYVEQTLTAETSLAPIGPTDTPEPTSGPLPFRTQPLPSSPEAPSPAPADTEPPADTAQPPSADLARPNGDIYHVAYAPTGPVIDGQLDDWNPMPYQFSTPVYKPEDWAGPSDTSVSFNLAWNPQYLFLAAIVVDDVHVQTQHAEMIYLGDSLEILLDTDLGGDFTATHLDADDYQLGLSPGALNGDTPEAYLWYPASRAGAATAVQLAAQPDGSGYRLEAAIPWALFNLTPAGNERYGFVLSASDDDTPDTAEQQKMIATVGTRKLVDPTSWGTLALDNP
jgi:hypothetical protein